jgi:hypothetical protein
MGERVSGVPMKARASAAVNTFARNPDLVWHAHPARDFTGGDARATHIGV